MATRPPRLPRRHDSGNDLPWKNGWATQEEKPAFYVMQKNTLTSFSLTTPFAHRCQRTAHGFVKESLAEARTSTTVQQ
jgi:hypothetical protein